MGITLTGADSSLVVLQNRVEEWIKDWRLSPAESRDLYLDTAALLRTNKVLHLTALASHLVGHSAAVYTA